MLLDGLCNGEISLLRPEDKMNRRHRKKATARHPIRHHLKKPCLLR